MGWLSQATFDELKAKAAAMTPAERAALTWETAKQFVAPDTLDLACWHGLQKNCATPWEAVRRLRGLDQE